MKKYSGQRPVQIPNLNTGFLKSKKIDVGTHFKIGKSAVYNEGGEAPTPLMTIIIEGGNTLPAPFSTLGIKRVLVAPTIANGGYDLSTNPTLPDGLGVARVLFGANPGTRVYVGNFPPNTIPYDIIANHIGCAYNSTVLVSPDTLTSITVWFPVRLG